VQLKYYDERMAEIQKAMNYFWDYLDGVPGIRAHRTDPKSDSTMGGWYFPHGLYVPEELGGLSITRFCKALQEEGCDMCSPGCNMPLHLHPLFNTCDVYGNGRPTRITNSVRDVRQNRGSLPVSEGIGKRTFAVPWFKHYWPEVIDEYVEAFKAVIYNYKTLLPDDPGDPEQLGNWHFFRHSA
jgi:dTDP-4-amino-4,6-dideoxygalactose transaminase